jgi:hypothetical protein
MHRTGKILAPLAALLALGAAPHAARAFDAQPETATLAIPTDGNGFIPLAIGSVAAAVDVGQQGTSLSAVTGSLQSAAPNSIILLSASATPAPGSAPGAVPPVVSMDVPQFNLGNASGTAILRLLRVDASAATPGVYQVAITLADMGPGYIVGQSTTAPVFTYTLSTSASTGGPLLIQIATNAADFNSMSSGTRMNVTISGTQVLVKAMSPAGSARGGYGGTDSTAGSGAACCPGHFRMIFHNTSAAATIQVVQGSSVLLLAPKDVIAVDVTTDADVTATVVDAASASLEMGYP